MRCNWPMAPAAFATGRSGRSWSSLSSPCRSSRTVSTVSTCGAVSGAGRQRGLRQPAGDRADRAGRQRLDAEQRGGGRHATGYHSSSERSVPAASVAACRHKPAACSTPTWASSAARGCVVTSGMVRAVMSKTRKPSARAAGLVTAPGTVPITCARHWAGRRV